MSKFDEWKKNRVCCRIKNSIKHSLPTYTDVRHSVTQLCDHWIIRLKVTGRRCRVGRGSHDVQRVTVLDARLLERLVETDCLECTALHQVDATNFELLNFAGVLRFGG